VELRQLRYAVAVADHLNFREASRALHDLSNQADGILGTRNDSVSVGRSSNYACHTVPIIYQTFRDRRG